MGGPHPVNEEPSRRDRGRGKSASLAVGVDIGFFYPQAGIYTMCSTEFQAFGLRLELYHRLSWVSSLTNADLGGS